MYFAVEHIEAGLVGVDIAAPESVGVGVAVAVAAVAAEAVVGSETVLVRKIVSVLAVSVELRQLAYET